MQVLHMCIYRIVCYWTIGVLFAEIILKNSTLGEQIFMKK